jgi:hypothetical protein
MRNQNFYLQEVGKRADREAAYDVFDFKPISFKIMSQISL